MTDHSLKVMTRAELEAEYGFIPPLTTTWTINRSHATVTYTTDDGGEHWIRTDVIWSEERNRRDHEALEQARIQRELK